jgi:RND family efflux transporter MFP subunit
MKRALLPVLLAMTAAGSAHAAGAAAVKTITPRRGGAPTVVVAYGQAAPAGASVRSLTLAQPGQVAAVLATPGQAVRKGQALIRFTTAPASLAAFRQAQTAVVLASAQQAHARLLLSQQLATRDQVGGADKALSDAQAQLAALSQDGAGRAVAVVNAPFDGVVVSLPVAAGDRPAAGATLASVAPATALQVAAGIEPGWRNQVRAGQAVQLEPLGGGPAIAGRVVRVDGVLNPRTRLVDVDIATAPGEAIGGEAFRVRIAVGEKQGWLVPHDAVRVEADQAFVFQLYGAKAARVNVRVLQAGRDTDVVEGPLDPRRPLVSVGAYQLDDGGAVRPMR